MPLLSDQARAPTAEELKGHDDAEALLAGLDTFVAREGQTLNRTQLAQQVDGFIHLHAADVLADREKRAWSKRGLWFTERDLRDSSPPLGKG